MRERPVLADSSLSIARDTGRPVDAAALPVRTAVSVGTLAGLHVRVLSAAGTTTRVRRLRTPERAWTPAAPPITVEAARRRAELRVRLAEEGRPAEADDLWIAAIASVDPLDVVTQDDAFDVIASVGGPAVITVRVDLRTACGAPPGRCRR